MSALIYCEIKFSFIVTLICFVNVMIDKSPQQLRINICGTGADFLQVKLFVLTDLFCPPVHVSLQCFNLSAT